jgi:hypothetical protein
MAFNKRLFHLGNKVVALGRKIDEDFPIPSGCTHGGENVFRDTLLKLLEVINEVRLAIQDEEPKEWWIVKVNCNSQEFLAIKEQMEVLELNYEILKPKSED